MKWKLTLQAGDRPDDIVITADATATVGQIAERLKVSHPRRALASVVGTQLTLRANPGTAHERLVPPETAMGESGIRSGDVVSVTGAAGSAAPRSSVATLNVRRGSDAGRTFQLGGGTSFLGRERSCDVRLSDPMVSKRHARINITDVVELIDDNSANGMYVGDYSVQRVVVSPTDEVRVGDTVFTVTQHVAASAGLASSTSIPFNRSPRLDPRYEGIELIAPEPPQRPQSQRFPIVPFIAPILMAGLMFWITNNAASIMFVALSPLMLIGNFIENRTAGAKAFRLGTELFRQSLTDLAVQLQHAADSERAGRHHEHPAVFEVTAAVERLDPITWTRRPEHWSFLQLRLGIGRQASRNSVRLPTSNNTTPELWRELLAVVEEFSTIERVPIVADLRDCGCIGIAGRDDLSHGHALSVLTQLVGLHSPAEVVLAALIDASQLQRWLFLKWLPHTTSEFSPLAVDHLVTAQAGGTNLIAAIEDLIDQRSQERRDQDQHPLPAVVLYVEDAAAAVDRSRLVQIAERGPAQGVHVVWRASTQEMLPAACRTYLQLDPNTGVGTVGFVSDGGAVTPVELEPIDLARAGNIARGLAPVVDAGALVEDQSDLPRSVSFLNVVGHEAAEAIEDIVERWKGSNSLPPVPNAPRLKRDNHLRAVVGQGVSDRFYLDLRTQGPHALVGGTTGAGKSEFLQSWILGMAAAHGPTRVNFLFVDYKGGAAFADCIHLPHSVGLVTDLSPHLVRRALTSLRAELRNREHILNSKKAKDLLELERSNDPECPPSLVIVVDEFAALVAEVPEFVDGVVNVAQRGRSLGLHLILATQRPAGVIKDNLRANTNLRVALRMADEADSSDVVGTPQAATFDSSLPGRGVAKTGPGRLTAFQTAYVGGWTTKEPPKPSVEIHEYPFGHGSVWDEPDEVAAPQPVALGPNDIRRIVTNIAATAASLKLPPARRPWMPELAITYRLEELPMPRNDVDLVFGVADVPEQQEQPTVGFHPDDDGNMAVYGTGAAGKSAFLRTLAVSAGFAPARGGPVTVYAFDFGARGLQMLEDLPHVAAVVAAEDHERIVRVLKTLRTLIDERSVKYAAVSADNVVEYRQRSGASDEARVLLLLDNFSAFRQAYELGERSRWFELFQSIMGDGRRAGVHVVIAADRPAALPSSLSSAVKRRLVLKMANENDYSMLGAPADALGVTSPPGRGFLDGHEVQVAVVGGEQDVALQANAISKMTASMLRNGFAPVPRVRRLPDRVLATDLPESVAGEPVLGLWDETFEPIGFDPSGVFLISGPPQSGRTTALASVVRALRVARPEVKFLYLGRRRSPLAGLEWEHAALTPDEIDTEAGKWATKIAAEDKTADNLVVIIEGVGDLLNSTADLALQELVKACRAQERFVIAEGETSSLAGSWPLLQAVKSGRYGMALQPEQVDGDSLFKTSFGRVNRSEFPAGRGLLVRSGRTYRVQVALPE